MANPIVRHSVDAATGATSGSSVDSLGHYHVGLFVAVDGDVTTLTVQLEVSPDGNRWALAEGPGGDAVQITDADLTTDPTSGEETAAVLKPANYATAYRARVVDYDATGPADAYVMAGGNAGQGNRPTSRKGPASNL